MTDKQEFIYLKIGKTIDKLSSCTDFLSKAQFEYKQNPGSKNVTQIFAIESKQLADCLNDCRNLYCSFPQVTEKAIDRYNLDITESLGLKLEKEIISDEEVYKITAPIILDKKMLNKELWINSFTTLYSKYNITRLDNAVIVFEHHFDKYGNSKLKKDVDNYDKSLLINLLQLYFIKDDRNIDVFDTNIFNSNKNQTVIYILSKESFINYLKKYN